VDAAARDLEGGRRRRSCARADRWRQSCARDARRRRRRCPSPNPRTVIRAREASGPQIATLTTELAAASRSSRWAGRGQLRGCSGSGRAGRGHRHRRAGRGQRLRCGLPQLAAARGERGAPRAPASGTELATRGAANGDRAGDGADAVGIEAAAGIVAAIVGGVTRAGAGGGGGRWRGAQVAAAGEDGRERGWRRWSESAFAPYVGFGVLMTSNLETNALKFEICYSYYSHERCKGST